MSQKLYSMEVGKVDRFRIVVAPASDFMKMRTGRLRLESIVRKEAERKAENARLIWLQQEASRQRIERARAYLNWCDERDAIMNARDEAARRAEAKRRKWWWQK